MYVRMEDLPPTLLKIVVLNAQLDFKIPTKRIVVTVV
jgi:hypothetical protein